MSKCIVYVNEREIANEIEKAYCFFKRLTGLIPKKRLSENEGVILHPCNQIHTFYMNFPIDAIYINKEDKIIYIEKNMLPNKIGKAIKNCDSVLELSGGMSSKKNIEIGDTIKIVEI